MSDDTQTTDKSIASAMDTMKTEISGAPTPPPPAPPTDGKAVVIPEWAQALPDELKAHGSIAKFKDLPSFAKSYLEAEKTLSTRFALLGEKATAEEWNAHYDKLGRPADKKYVDGEIPEGDKDLMAKYEAILYESGLSKRQGQEVLKGFDSLLVEIESGSKAQLEEVKAKNLDVLKKTYGDMDSKIPVIEAAIQKIGSQELAALVTESSYNPGLIKLLVAYGETMKSDSLVTGQSSSRIVGKEAALEEIKRLKNDEKFMAQYTGNDVGHDAAVARMSELHALAYGN